MTNYRYLVPYKASYSSIFKIHTIFPVAHLSFHRSSLSSSHRAAAAAAATAAVTAAAPAVAAALGRKADSLLLRDDVRVKDTTFRDALPNFRGAASAGGSRSNLSEFRV